ncbi:trypsin-like peptidase domain-containing protein [Streptomyces sp. NPDC048182]|uniref:trypsin-like peptidase domain-containing protein n=1 Tax=Streptomyces sp. NPDC048182 TaxID=3365507 RepID=UPI0037238BE3
MTSRNRSRTTADGAEEVARGAVGLGPCGPDEALVRIHDLAGRPRGTGFAADHHGTVITSHEAVDGLRRLVLHTLAGRRRVVSTADVTSLPALGLALVRTGGLGLAPLPVAARQEIAPGAYVRIAADSWREARVLNTTEATYTATDRFHHVPGVLELAVGTAGRDALRLGGGAAGGPVLDPATGAVLGVLGTALDTGHGDLGLALPLPPTVPGPLAELLAENAATVPAFGLDLNPAGVLALTAAVPGPAPDGGPEPVEREEAAGELAAFGAGATRVLGLVGAPGTGRTTLLADLAARRAQGTRPAPTLRLRGADLHDDDASLGAAAHRALIRGTPGVPVSVDRLAEVAREAGRPLLVLLDGPEEMPPALAHRLPAWTEATAAWLAETGTRLVVACRPEYWERAGAEFPAELLHTPRHPDAGRPAEALPPCLRLGDLSDTEARRARVRHGVPDGALTCADARHPLTLRLFAEVHAALPEPPPPVPVDRDAVFAAHLDLTCLRVAVRLAADEGLHGTAVRRLAAKVSGRVHEAARRSLGAGQGGLDRDAFAEVFPEERWAAAVLAEGLFVPAGDGHRFAHEELADWIQGTHLDLPEALRALVHRRGAPAPPLPYHRIGPVTEALLSLARQHGVPQLALTLEELTHTLEDDPPSWWATRLLAEVLTRVPDATPYAEVLRLLADGLALSGSRGRPPQAEFGPAFWTALRLPAATRLDLLRRLVLADGPPHEPGPRHIDTVAALLAADTAAVQPLLVRWFEDDRPLPATPHATVARAAQALLHTHRHRGMDGLTEALADSAHPRADELLAVLAEEEPSALCRAAERWARDTRPERRRAAARHGLRAAPHARTDADRTLLRHAALALLGSTGDGPDDALRDTPLLGGALALLVHDPGSRDRHLTRALARFAAGDPHLPPSAIAAALPTHPDPVLDAFRVRLGRPDAEEPLHALLDAATPALARRVAALLGPAATTQPALPGRLAAHVDRRLTAAGPAARTLLPLVTALLDDGPEPVRAALAGVLAADGTPACAPLRRELREHLLAREHDPAVLDALLHAAAAAGEGDTRRALVHRTGLLLVRTPDGAARFDRGLVDLARHVPGFAAHLTGWLADAPLEWAALVGPSARRTIDHLAAAARVPA